MTFAHASAGRRTLPPRAAVRRSFLRERKTAGPLKHDDFFRIVIKTMR
jgi:hypothetical protein